MLRTMCLRNALASTTRSIRSPLCRTCSARISRTAVRAEQRSAHRSLQDRVGVPLAARPAAGIEAVRGHLRPNARQVLGKERVQPRCPRLDRKLAVELQGGHLPPGVYARIGPARARHPYRSTVEPRDPLLELVLHAASIGLHLPPDEVRAVVLEGELEGGHFESSCTFTTGLGEDVSAYANRASRSLRFRVCRPPALLPEGRKMICLPFSASATLSLTIARPPAPLIALFVFSTPCARAFFSARMASASRWDAKKSASACSFTWSRAPRAPAIFWATCPLAVSRFRSASCCAAWPSLTIRSAVCSASFLSWITFS